MKALIVDNYGPPQTAHSGEVEIPKPSKGQLLVNIRAAAVNPFDNKIITGQAKDFFPIEFPYVPGMDGAGTVVEVGEGVSNWNEGDAVMGMFESGTLAEYALVKATSKRLTRKPDALDFEHAAAIPETALTALTAIRASGLQAGQSILILGATGGVGLFATQLAKEQGARVIATGGPADEEYLRHLGADEIVDYKNVDPVTETRRLIREGVDVVIDLVNSGEALLNTEKALRSPGTLVSTLFGPEQQAFRGGVTVHYIQMTAKDGDLADLAERAADGRLRVEVGHTYDLAHAATALTDLNDASKHRRGKSVVRIGTA